MWPRQEGCSIGMIHWDDPLGCHGSGLESGSWWDGEGGTSLFYQHPKNSEERAGMQRCWEG